VVAGLVPNGDRITVRQLLSHTSGLANYTDDPRFTPAYLRAHPDLRYTPRQLVRIATAMTPRFAPGRSWSYSNTNYIVVGLIVERASGASLGWELRQRVIAPLGLRHTRFEADGKIRGRFAHGYERLGYSRYVDVSGIRQSWGWAAGALDSTAVDLADFYRALLSGKLLRPELLRAMEKTVPTTAGGGPSDGYGLGIASTPVSCRRLVWGHTGGLPGYSALAASSPDGQRQLIVLLNVAGVPLAGFTVDQLLERVFCP
jgi:D-alanyl-D-alanine carboxypeptidase